MSMKMVVSILLQDGNGFIARCPFCGIDNIANFGENGELIWYPNDEIGIWCKHCRGAYSSGGLKSPAFAFSP